MNSLLQGRHPVVNYPVALEEGKFSGPLYGFYYPDANEYNIVEFGEKDSISLAQVGIVLPDPEQAPAAVPADWVIGFWKDDKLVFRHDNKTCKKQSYDLIQDIFSRHSGILETPIMLNKRVVIIGCGSVGSLAALELARSGVGNFLLIDHDTLAYHNLCRHQSGLADVGKFKVNTVRERLLQINPKANVVTQPTILEQVPKDVFDDFCISETIFMGCTDNREGDLRANEIAHLYNSIFVSIGFWERACAGEIFYYIPGKTPCYCCLFGRADLLGLSNRVSTSRRFYTTEENIANIRFEPGISTDISFVTLIGIKIILDLLNRDNPVFIPRLINQLTQFTLVCNTENPQIGGEQVEVFSYPLQVTTSVRVDYDSQCPVCGNTGPGN